MPTARELVLLRDLQRRLNLRTRDLEDQRQATSGEASDAWSRAINRLYQKQGSVSDMTGHILEEFQKARAAEEAGHGGEAPHEGHGGEAEGEGGEK